MQMDEMTQQNAALVEQATAATQSMADRARELNAMMSRYQIEEGRASAPAMAPTAASPAASPRVERRSTTRPWSGKGGKSTASVDKAPEAPASRKVAVAGAGDADWQEF
jgi:methyl-accepting chemotaxis protein